jgi:hypothetical protein
MDQKQSIVRELIKEVKGDYKVPGKLFVWGVVITIIGSIFLAMLVYFIMLSFGSSRNVEQTNTIQNIGEAENIKGSKELSVHLKKIVKFMEASAESVSVRQDILERLTNSISLYMGRSLNQAQLEEKVKDFSSLMSACNEYRGMYMDTFARNINPFDDPNISRAFDELILGHAMSRHALDPQEENKRWEALCAFCHQEANKAKDELVQILKSGEDTQTEGAAQTSFFK